MTGAWARVLAVMLCPVPCALCPVPCAGAGGGGRLPEHFRTAALHAAGVFRLACRCQTRRPDHRQCPDTTCGARYGTDARVQVTVKDATGAAVLEELAPMSDDGGFTFVFTLPTGVAPGKAGVTAYPYNLDWCDDTGVNNRAAQGPAELVRVSCTEPLVPLVILGPGA
ncbi:hypothetical protein AHiyo4_48130 [Arthrobacter sp. Hiyo4]|nr:hypothetical protein AHiyo4_48130 [Arthrobacter sp. Hiyo4]